MTFIDRLVCTQVCQSWRAATFNWPLMWSVISNGDFLERGYFDFSKVLVAYAMHIQKASVRGLHLVVLWPHISLKKKNAELLKTIDSLIALGCNQLAEGSISQRRTNYKYTNWNCHSENIFWLMVISVVWQAHRLCGQQYHSVGFTALEIANARNHPFRHGAHTLP